MRENSYRHTESSAETEVGHFDESLVVDQQILRFQVSVQHPPHVTEQNGLHDLKSLQTLS